MLDAYTTYFVMQILITTNSIKLAYLKVPLQQGSLSTPA